MGGIKMAIIDGTGVWNDKDYAVSMHDSFCAQLGRQLGQDAYYQRGPSGDGTSVRSKAVAAYDWIMAKHEANGSDRLMLAGYSRGASAVIYTAEFLEEKGVPVDSLYLFDAVARHIYPGGEVIPDNVHFSRHARRSQDPAFVAKYEDSIGYGENPTRPSFGQTGTSYLGSGDHSYATFLGSHGALGGVGWSVVTEDPACQRAVAAYMNGALLARRVNVALTAVSPTGAPVKAPTPAGFQGHRPTMPTFRR